MCKSSHNTHHAQSHNHIIQKGTSTSQCNGKPFPVNDQFLSAGKITWLATPILNAISRAASRQKLVHLISWERKSHFVVSNCIWPDLSISGSQPLSPHVGTPNEKHALAALNIFRWAIREAALAADHLTAWRANIRNNLCHATTHSCEISHDSKLLRESAQHLANGGRTKFV